MPCFCPPGARSPSALSRALRSSRRGFRVCVQAPRSAGTGRVPSGLVWWKPCPTTYWEGRACPSRGQDATWRPKPVSRSPGAPCTCMLSRFSLLWLNSPGKDTGVGCHALLQGIFRSQGCLLPFLHWQPGSLPLAPPAPLGAP